MTLDTGMPSRSRDEPLSMLSLFCASQLKTSHKSRWSAARLSGSSISFSPCFSTNSFNSAMARSCESPANKCLDSGHSKGSKRSWP
jgi:hypothetical protein